MAEDTTVFSLSCMTSTCYGCHNLSSNWVFTVSRRVREEIESWIRELVEDEMARLLEKEDIALPGAEERETRHEARVKRELTEKGHILELRAYQELVRNDWEASLQDTHWDIDTNESRRPWQEYGDDITSGNLTKVEREIDVAASKSVNPTEGFVVSAETDLAIECKYRSRENWAFFLEPLVSDQVRSLLETMGGPHNLRGSISMFDSIDIECRHNPKLVGDEFFVSNPVRFALQRASHHYLTHLSEVSVRGWSLFGLDSLTDACEKALDVALFLKAEKELSLFGLPWKKDMKPTQFFWRVYPVVVFDGPLWSITLEPDGFRVDKIPWVTHRILRKNYEYFIDIVRWDSFEAYLRELEAEFKRIQTIET